MDWLNYTITGIILHLFFQRYFNLCLSFESGSFKRGGVSNSFIITPSGRNPVELDRTRASLHTGFIVVVHFQGCRNKSPIVLMSYPICYYENHFFKQAISVELINIHNSMLKHDPSAIKKPIYWNCLINETQQLKAGFLA